MTIFKRNSLYFSDLMGQETKNAVNSAGCSANKPYIMLPLLYLGRIEPYLSGSHIDYGCGNGKLTNKLRFVQSLTDITGYDISDENIINAKKEYQGNKVRFLSKKELRRENIYDSASLNFVFHETGHTVLNEVYDLLRNGGRISVLDYDMKYIKSKDEFSRVFICQSELDDIKRLGIDNAFLLHTSFGLEECIQSAEKLGFRTLANEKLCNKYFVWIGEKQ